MVRVGRGKMRRVVLVEPETLRQVRQWQSTFGAGLFGVKIGGEWEGEAS